MRRISTLAVALLLGLALSAQTARTSDGRVDSLLVDAVQKYESSDIKSAALALAKLKIQYPDNDAVLYYLGLCDIALHDIHAASEHLGAAARADTANLWYASTLANVYLALNNVEAAYPLVKKIIEKNPATFANPYTLSVLGEMELAHQRDTAAMEYYDQALALDPTYLAARVRKAELYRMTGRDSSCRAELSSIIADPATPDEMKPDLHIMMLQLALKDKDDAKVIQECRNLLSCPQLDSAQVLTALSVLGDTYYTGGKRKQAFKVYDMALKINPKYLPVLNNYAYFLSEERRQLKKALRMSRITIKIEPENPIYLDTCGWILHLLGHSDQAEPLFKQAIVSGGRSSAVILEHYADVLDAVGKHNTADYYRELSKKL